ncbi:MAG: WG repeat-containing protein [Bacteroidota bacterium]|nr:WG repeat-containing protein [Bacteroidota bacterium]
MIRFSVFLLILLSHSVFGQGNGLYGFRSQSGKYGFIDQHGKIRIQPVFLIVNDFNDGRCFVSRETSTKGYKWICIDTLGNEVFNIQDDFPETTFNEGFARISNFSTQWFIDKIGNRVFNKSFKDGRGNFSNGFAIVSDEKFQNYYYINKTGEKVIFLPHGDIHVFDKGLAIVWNEEFKLIDTLGKQIGGKYELIGGWNEGLIKAKKDNRWGFINTKGITIIDFKYTETDFDKNDSAKKIPLSNLKNISLFHEGLAIFQKDSLWGVINNKNEVIIKPAFKKLSTFSEGLAAASLDGEKFGFIDTAGIFLIKPQFYLADSFKNGVCAVKLNKTRFEIANDYHLDAIINSKGEILNQLEMHCYMGFRGALIQYYGGFHFSGGVFYLDEKGKVVVPHN